MTTSAARGFRAHHAVTHSPGSPVVVRQLLEEWTFLSTSTDASEELAAWAELEPSLEGHTTLAELVDAVDAGDRVHADQALCSLSRLAQSGHSLAGRVALQIMLPALSSLPRRCRASAETVDERWQMTLACFYSVLHRLHAEGNIASRLMLDTLHAVTAETRSSDAGARSRSIAVADLSDLAEREVEAVLVDVDEHSDLTELLVWAVRTDVLNVREAQLLADSCLPARRPAHGEHHLSAADRKCRTRARRKLIDAVRGYVGVEAGADAA